MLQLIHEFLSRNKGIHMVICLRVLSLKLKHPHDYWVMAEVIHELLVLDFDTVIMLS
uniref:Uncharacterized protein n=1 Tax=Arundo donax TaxID=35708 RepID=A0A0A9CIA9_ARUDO